jgi:hypothetical protein
MNTIIHKNLLLIFISIVINLNFCLNAPPTSVEKEKYMELTPVDNSEDEFYKKYKPAEDNHEDEEYTNNAFLKLSNLHLRNLQNYHEMMFNKYKAVRDIGFGKRGDSVDDSQIRNYSRWRSFMDAHYGKRSIS